MKPGTSRRPSKASLTVVVIGGPKAAGKTTYAESLLLAMGISEFVNADASHKDSRALMRTLSHSKRVGSCSTGFAPWPR